MPSSYDYGSTMDTRKLSRVGERKNRWEPKTVNRQTEEPYEDELNDRVASFDINQAYALNAPAAGRGSGLMPAPVSQPMTPIRNSISARP